MAYFLRDDFTADTGLFWSHEAETGQTWANPGGYVDALLNNAIVPYLARPTIAGEVGLVGFSGGSDLYVEVEFGLQRLAMPPNDFAETTMILELLTPGGTEWLGAKVSAFREFGGTEWDTNYQGDGFSTPVVLTPSGNKLSVTYLVATGDTTVAVNGVVVDGLSGELPPVAVELLLHVSAGASYIPDNLIFITSVAAADTPIGFDPTAFWTNRARCQEIV